MLDANHKTHSFANRSHPADAPRFCLLSPSVFWKTTIGRFDVGDGTAPFSLMLFGFDSFPPAGLSLARALSFLTTDFLVFLSQTIPQPHSHKHAK